MTAPIRPSYVFYCLPLSLSRPLFFSLSFLFIFSLDYIFLLAFSLLIFFFVYIQSVQWFVLTTIGYVSLDGVELVPGVHDNRPIPSTRAASIRAAKVRWSRVNFETQSLSLDPHIPGTVWTAR